MAAVITLIDSDEELIVSDSETEGVSLPIQVPEPLDEPGSGSWGDAFMEVYSPPRVNIAVRRRGLAANVSLDLLTGCDLSTFQGRRECMDKLQMHQPLVLLVCPPCTMYSPLQALFNLHKMDPETLAMRWAEAHGHLDFSMFLCKYQRRRRRYFIFEHPQRASSWTRPSVEEEASQPSAQKTTWDQCQTGLRTPDEAQVPIKKRTTILSNLPAVHHLFSPLQCNGSCGQHQHIEGSINGISLSHWCQMYPAPMCEKLAEAVQSAVETGPAQN